MNKKNLKHTYLTMFSPRESNLRFTISLRELVGTPSLMNGEHVFLRATIWPVALTLPLKTFPYDPSPIFCNRSYFSMFSLYQRHQRHQISRIRWEMITTALSGYNLPIHVMIGRFIELKILERKRHDSSSHFVNVVEFMSNLNYFTPSLLERIHYYMKGAF